MTSRTYRARVYFRLGQHLEATEDFSLALHLDPNNWVAFYNRGCLLRRINPDMALKDLSTSGRALHTHTHTHTHAFKRTS